MAIVKMSDESYFKLPAVSNSLLSRFAKCPAACQVDIEPTPSMHFGSLAHAMILEGKEAVLARYAEMSDFNGTTKEGKKIFSEWLEKNNMPLNTTKTSIMCGETKTPEGKLIVTLKQLKDVVGQVQSIIAHPTARDFLSQGQPEMAITWQDEETGLHMKSKADWLRHDMLIDLKTTQCADRFIFKRNIWNMGYGMQMGIYHDGLIANFHHVKTVAIIAVETNAPYCCNVFNITDEALERGKIQYRELIRRYKIHKETGVFPSYQYAGMIDVTVPAYLKEIDG